MGVKNYSNFFIVHKGSKLTRKSVLLPCQIKDLCNIYEMIIKDDSRCKLDSTGFLCHIALTKPESYQQTNKRK